MNILLVIGIIAGTSIIIYLSFLFIFRKPQPPPATNAEESLPLPETYVTPDGKSFHRTATGSYTSSDGTVTLSAQQLYDTMPVTSRYNYQKPKRNPEKDKRHLEEMHTPSGQTKPTQKPPRRSGYHRTT